MIAFFVVTFIVALLAVYNLRERRPYGFRLYHTGMHTEYCGPGRVWFISFFGGVGRVTILRRGRGWNGKPLDAPGWDPSIYIPGFTLYIRTARSRVHHRYGTGKPVRWIRLTRNAHHPVI